MSNAKFFLKASHALFFRDRRLSVPESPRLAVLLYVLLYVLLLFPSLPFLASCDNQDDPAVTIDYFFTVSSKPPDYEPVMKSDLVFTITAQMKASMRNVYPKPTVEGDDAAVIAACDEEYQLYLQKYHDADEGFYCEAQLRRARMRGTIVLSYVTIRYYNF